MSQAAQILLPEIILTAVACLLFLGGTVRAPARVWAFVALAGLAVAGWSFDWQPDFPLTQSSTSVVTHDLLATSTQGVALLLGALFVLASIEAQKSSDSAPEFYGLLLLVITGTMLVACARDLILMVLALELVSIPTYVLLYLGRRNHASQEAAVKYFLLSVLSAAMLLYGFAFIYGLTGSTQLGAIRAVLDQTYATLPGSAPFAGSALGVVALVLIFAGLGFKISAVPFHFYAPDVYEGTSAYNAGLLAVIPKAAGVLALMRVVAETMVGYETTASRLAVILAIVTMLLGNCLALWQTNVRRMLAYSSVAHAGYMLIGLAVGFWETWNPSLGLGTGSGLLGGMQAVLLYLLAYAAASAGMFFVLSYLDNGKKQIDHIDELTGLFRHQPVMAIAAAIFLFSMAGIPPLAGFWGKLAIFSSALSVRTASAQLGTSIDPYYLTLAVIGVLNAAVAAVYYVRLVAIMFLNEPVTRTEVRGGLGPFAAITASLVLVLAIGIAPGPVFSYLSKLHGQPTATASAQGNSTPIRVTQAR